MSRSISFEQPSPGSFRNRWLARLTVLLFGLLVLAIGGALISEWQAAIRLNRELARIRNAGFPVDDESMARWFAASTSTEGTAAWAEAMRLTTSSPLPLTHFDQIPYVGYHESPPLIRSAEDWPQEPLVADYLNWMSPAIEQMHRANRYPKPVWQPIEFRGFFTQFDKVVAARSLARLMLLEVEHALAHGDADRALRGLDTLGGVAGAFDWQFCLVADLIHQALVGVHHNMVLQSMSIGLWDEEHLDQLAKLVGPAGDWEARWEKVISGERGMLLAFLSSPDLSEQINSFGSEFEPLSQLLRFPSQRESLLRGYDSLLAIGNGSLRDLRDRADAAQRLVFHRNPNDPRRFSWFQLTQTSFMSVFPATQAYAEAIQRSENDRRLAHTALSIKRFQLHNGRWPTTLRELDPPDRSDPTGPVGPEFDTRRTLSGEWFGYEVDGDQAWLWGAKWRDSKVAPNRPDLEDSEDQNSRKWALIR